MKNIIFLSLVSFFFLIEPSHAQIEINESNYGLDRADFLDSTIAGTFIGTPGGTRWTQIKFNMRKRKIRGFSSFMKIRYHQSLCGRKSNHLIFIIPGIGAKASNGRSNYFAHAFKQKCYDVVILPSAFTSQFVITASKNGIVGDSQQDARDYYELLKYTRNYLYRTRSHRYSEFSIFSFSLGSLHSAHIAKLDKKERAFNFKKVLLINPPNDLLKSLTDIDAMVRQGRGISSRRKFKIFYKMAKNMWAKYRYRFNPSQYKIFLNRVKTLHPREKKYLIGMGLTITLDEVILSSQGVMQYDRGRDLGVLPPSRYEEAREEAAKNYTMLDYVYKFVMPFKRRFEGVYATDAELNYTFGLSSLEKFFGQSDNIYLFHNLDDFLLTKGDIGFYSDTLRSKFTLYPHGGHCGNMWFTMNINSYINTMTNDMI
ncbi:MAG: hypothetical protein CME62_05680 [Halobacteriovoraceae bacterium]|nr:hypothetical protein [Halobacteriovoraceae bacterium]